MTEQRSTLLNRIERNAFNKLVRFLVKNDAVCAEFKLVKIPMDTLEALAIKDYVLLETFADLNQVKIARKGYPVFEKKKDAKDLKDKMIELKDVATHTLIEWKKYYNDRGIDDMSWVAYKSIVKTLNARV